MITKSPGLVEVGDVILHDNGVPKYTCVDEPVWVPSARNYRGAFKITVQQYYAPWGFLPLWYAEQHDVIVKN